MQFGREIRLLDKTYININSNITKLFDTYLCGIYQDYM